MRPTGKNRIGFTESEAFAYKFKTFNPAANRENDFEIFAVTEKDFESALRKAKSCFTGFSNLPGKKRAAFLRAISGKLLQNQHALINYYCLESALPESRALIELKRTIHQLEEFAALISVENWNFIASEAADPDRTGNPKPSLHKVYKAIGPVAVFGASNFPFAYSTIGGDSASALAAGCPVIVKSHAMHAGTGDLVARLILEAALETGMPDGVFSNLNGKGNGLGEKLVQHPVIKAVGFTGSFTGGMALFRLAQGREEPIPFFAEMSSVNPVLIFADAFQKSLAEKIARSVSLNAGQFCTNPGLIFLVDSPASREFVAELAEKLSEVDEQVMLHPQIYENYQLNAAKLEKNNSVKNLVKTNYLSKNNIRPILRKTDAESFLSNPDLRAEVFGSHTLVVVLKDDSEFAQIIEALQGQLTFSIFALDKELKRYTHLLHLLEQKAGRLIFNGVPTGVEVCRAMHHGGPFPATTDSRFTAVGKDAIYRFLRPVCYQDLPAGILI